jgi:hypothetical protein
VIPIDRGQHRSEATLDFAMLVKLSTIVKQNQCEKQHHPCFSSVGTQGAANLVND